MTAIVAIIDGDRAIMAGDSAVSGDGDIAECVEPKVLRRGSVLFGIAGKTRSCNLVETLRVPAYKGGDPYAFVRDEIAPDLAVAFRGASHVDGDFVALVTLGGAIVLIDDEFGVTQRRGGYEAIGSGAAYALGALHASKGLRMKARATRALEAAARHCDSVRAPWTFATV